MQKTESLLVISIIIVLILLTVTVAFIFHIEKNTSLREESVTIHRIDTYIQNGYSGEAEKSILELSRKDLSASSHIRLLKRAWLLERSAGGGEVSDRLLEKTAESAYRSFPARQDIAAVYVYALLRRGEHEHAGSVYADAELNEDAWRNLSNEMILYSSEAEEGMGEADSSGMFRLSRQSSADTFLGIYQSTGADGFLLDAVLLLLEAGEVDRAYSLVQTSRPGAFPPRFSFFLAYDAGKWNTALGILNENPQLFPLREQQLLRADLFMRLRRYDDAQEAYRTVYSSDSDGSADPGGTELDWTAAYNLLYLDLQTDDSLDDELSTDILRRAKEGLGSPVIMDIAGLMIAYGQTDHVQTLLSGYSEDGRIPGIELLQESTRSTVNPERYSSLLWRIVSQEDSPEYAIHLAWFLLGLEDFSGLQNLLDYSRKKFGTRSWTEFFQGTVALYQRRYEEAAEYFRDSYRMKAHWCSAYNAAAAYMAAGRADAALEQLELAELALTEAKTSVETQTEGDVGDADGKGFVDVLLKRVELYLSGGNYEAAGKVLQEIEEYDPNNLQADIYRGMISVETGN